MTYVDAAIQSELAKLHNPSGSRNAQLFASAAALYQLAAGGSIDEAILTDMLSTEGHALGLDRQEIKDTLRSAQRAGSRQPRTAPTPGQRLVAFVAPITAPDPCEPPCAAWQAAAAAFLSYAQDQLWDGPEAALDTLEARGLNARTVFNGRLGHNPQHLTRSRGKWGLPADDKGDALYIPAGIVLPYVIDRVIFKVEIRTAAGKYTLPGSANALWGADQLGRNKPAILVEGVFNALTIVQEAGDLITPVALGAATHCRRIRWLAPLAGVGRVLISTDAGKAGEDAAAYWLSLLQHNGARWRPYVDDPNAMLQAGMDVRAWVQAGLS